MGLVEASTGTTSVDEGDTSSSTFEGQKRGVARVARPQRRLHRSRRTKIPPAEVDNVARVEFESIDLGVTFVTSRFRSIVFENAENDPFFPMIDVMVGIGLVGDVNLDAVALSEPLHHQEQEQRDS